MSNSIRFLAAVIVALIISSLLFLEPWFTWRIWVVFSLFFGLWYYVFCITQSNLQSVATALIKTLLELKKKDGEND